VTLDLVLVSNCSWIYVQSRKESHERTMHSSANSLWVWNTKIPRSDLPILQYSKPCLLGGNGVPVFKVWGSELNFIVFSLEV